MIDIVRRPTAPASLAQKQDWRGEDVLRALHEDFLHKCYLCEKPVTLGQFQVDHREQKGGCPERTFDWTNLFPICPSCQGRRAKGYPPAGLLDPGGGQDLERRVVQEWHPERKYPAVFTALSDVDAQAVGTAAELGKIHGDGSLKALDILGAVVEVLKPVMAAQRLLLGGSVPEPEQLRCEAELRARTSRRAPYTMLVRSRIHPKFHHLFD